MAGLTVSSHACTLIAIKNEHMTQNYRSLGGMCLNSVLTVNSSRTSAEKDRTNDCSVAVGDPVVMLGTGTFKDFPVNLYHFFQDLVFL